MATGCGREPGSIEVDVSARPVAFTIHHYGWPRPFSWPCVTEFAIASDEDVAMWQLESVDPKGVPANQLMLVYGEVPDGFIQTAPAGQDEVKPLQVGRTYFVAAGGPDSIYRMVFALPMDGIAPMPPQLRRRPGVQPTTSSAPADDFEVLELPQPPPGPSLSDDAINPTDDGESASLEGESSPPSDDTEQAKLPSDSGSPPVE